MSLGAIDRERRAQTLALGARELGLAPNDGQLQRLLRYLDLLAQWSRSYNLTAIRDPGLMLTHHLLDSLALAPHLFGDRVLDLGTGAGLPGLPLAILDPGRRYWLLDSNGKKVRFVRQAVMDLGLANVEPVHSRIESYRPGQNFSTIVARAVASIAELHGASAPLLERPGRLLLMKGRYPSDELEHPAIVGLDLVIRPLRVPFLDGERHLIEIRRE